MLVIDVIHTMPLRIGRRKDNYMIRKIKPGLCIIFLLAVIIGITVWFCPVFGSAARAN